MTFMGKWKKKEEEFKFLVGKDVLFEDFSAAYSGEKENTRRTKRAVMSQLDARPAVHKGVASYEKAKRKK